MKIILACAAGMSTSMLVKRMEDSAREKGVELSISAVPVSELDSHIEGVQIILLGPQVSYLEDNIASKFPKVPVRVVDMMDYGMMNGSKVLEDAVEAIKEWEEK